MGAFQNGRKGGNRAYGKITGAYRHPAGNQHRGEKPRRQADAGVHELVQCRIFFQSNPSFRGVVAYLCFGGIASGKSYKKFIKCFVALTDIK